MKKAMLLGFLVLAGLCVWMVVFTLKFKLERFIVPAYPAPTASLRQIMGYYQKELAKQGMNVQIQITDETDLDEPRDVRGIAGGTYAFLQFRGCSIPSSSAGCFAGSRLAVSVRKEN